jgi:hypothetical protein
MLPLSVPTEENIERWTIDMLRKSHNCDEIGIEARVINQRYKKP